MDFDSQGPDAATIPSELLRKAPRRTRVTGNGLALSLGGAFILLLALWAGASSVLSTVRQAQLRTALRSGSVEATGWKEKLLHGSRGQDELLRYSFAVDGQRYTGEARVPMKHLQAVASSEVVQVRYLPANPAVNHPADWEWSPQWGAVVFLPLIAGLGVLLLVAVRADRQLAANGRPVLAAVTQCSPNAKGGYIVKYEFRAEDGTEVHGSGWTQSARDAGAKICVLYLPGNPTRNQVYPGQLVRAADC